MGEYGECNEESQERFEMYDPEGFRGNVQCTTCRTTFGSTKSSYTPLDKSIIAIMLDELSYPEVKYLQDNDVITVNDLKHHAVGNPVALGCFMKFFDHNVAKRREAERTHRMYESIRKSFEEHDFDKCPQIMCRGEWYDKDKIEWLLRMLG
jgi:hypothetical protein